MSLPEKGLWKMVSTPDHQVYYFHTSTKETKWELNEEEIEEMVAGMKALFQDKEGKLYFGNAVDGNNVAVSACVVVVVKPQGGWLVCSLRECTTQCASEHAPKSCDDTSLCPQLTHPPINLHRCA